MSFYFRFRTPEFDVVMRRADGDILVGRKLVVEVDFRNEVLDERGCVLPEDALGRLQDLLAAEFADKLLVDNNDPHADSLVKLKRIGAVDPVLFDHGTSGPQLSFYVGRKVEEWLDRERWNPSDPEDPANVTVALATIRLGRDEFFYDLA